MVLLVLLYRALEFAFVVPKPVTGVSPELLGVVDATRARMAVCTLSTSILLILALARCFAPSTTTTASQVWAALGCLAFVVSDTLLSYARLVRPFPFSEGVFLLFYFVGQTCLAMSVPAWGQPQPKAEAGEEMKEASVRPLRPRKSRKVE